MEVSPVLYISPVPTLGVHAYLGCEGGVGRNGKNTILIDSAQDVRPLCAFGRGGVRCGVLDVWAGDVGSVEGEYCGSE